jgi:LEA14-like dessication related protein
MAHLSGTRAARAAAARFLRSDLLLGMLACAGCTPLGLWDYTDPRVELGRIQLALDADIEPLGVVLAVNNPNLYEMTLTGAEAQLQLDGQPVGHGIKAEASTLPQRGTAEVHVPMPASDSLRRALANTLRRGLHSYLIQGHVTLQTPIGVRRIPFEASGSGQFGQIGT